MFGEKYFFHSADPINVLFKSPKILQDTYEGIYVHVG